MSKFEFGKKLYEATRYGVSGDPLIQDTLGIKRPMFDIQHTIVKAALHEHLRTSSYITREDAASTVKKAYLRLGKGGVLGVINFNPNKETVDPRWESFKKEATNRFNYVSTENGLYFPDYEILTIRGQEVPTDKGHILLIGGTEDQNIPNGTSLEKTLDKADEWGLWKAIDHPFHKEGLGPFLLENPEFLQRFNGYELYNGEAATPHPKYLLANEEGRKYYDAIVQSMNLDLSGFAGSDGHSIPELGKSYSRILMPYDYKGFKDSPEKVISALRKGFNVNREENLGHQTSSGILGAINHISDLIFLTACSNFLKCDPNTQTAPFMERFGIKI